MIWCRHVLSTFMITVTVSVPTNGQDAGVRSGAEQGSAEAQKTLGLMLIRGGRFRAKTEWLAERAGSEWLAAIPRATS